MKRIWLGALALFLLPLPSFAQYDGFTGVLGTTTFLGPLIGLPADNCATPPFTFNGDLTSGLCSTAVGSLGLQAAGYKRLHVDGDSFIVRSRTAVPTALTAGAPSGGAGNIDNGVHSYKVTFVTSSGETTLGVASNTLTVVDKTANGKCALSAIPLGQTGVVTDRKIYRTLAGGAVYYFIAALGNNTATTYTDNISDATALAGGLSPAVNSTNDFRMVVAPTSVQTSVPLLLPDGTAAAPSLAFTSDPDTGFRWHGVAQGFLKFVSNGTTVIDLGPSSMQLAGNLTPSPTDTVNHGAATLQWASSYLSRSIQGSKSKALTESSATSFVRIAVAQTAASAYGGGREGYTVFATDGTDFQSLVGDIRWAMVNKAGIESCSIGEIGTPALAESTGASTLACTFTCATAAADTIDLFANCVSSLVQTTFTIEYRADMQKTNTYTPQ